MPLREKVKQNQDQKSFSVRILSSSMGMICENFLYTRLQKWRYMWLVGRFGLEKSMSQPNHIWPPLPPSQFTFVRFPLSLPLAVAGVVTSCSLISHSWRRTWIFTTPPKPCWPIEIHPARFFSISFCSRKTSKDHYLLTNILLLKKKYKEFCAWNPNVWYLPFRSLFCIVPAVFVRWLGLFCLANLSISDIN